jgi:F0F1-type ATP synthase alpha subunit
MQIKAEEISQIIKDQIAGYKKDVDLKETGTVLSVVTVLHVCMVLKIVSHGIA